MSARQVIANYEALSALTHRMRETAEEGQWETLIGIERERSTLLESIKQLDADTKLDAASSEHKDGLLKSILADDAQTQVSVKAWMDQFQMLMQSTSQELRLLKKYGA